MEREPIHKIISVALAIISGLLSIPPLVSANYFTLPAENSPINAWFDHDGDEDGSMTSYVGTEYEGAGVDLTTCNLYNGGAGCYDDHNGIDFDGDSGDDIFAAATGTVRDVYWNNLSWYAAINNYYHL